MEEWILICRKTRQENRNVTSIICNHYQFHTDKYSRITVEVHT